MANQARAFVIFLRNILFLITSSTLINHSQSQTQEDYDRCAPFDCGNITFSFPFSRSESFGSGIFDCGLPPFKVACDGTSPTIELSGRPYQVKQLYLSDRLITVVDHQLINEVNLGSCKSFRNLTIPVTNDTAGAGAGAGAGASLLLPVGGMNLTIFECPNGLALSGGFLDGVVGDYNCNEEGNSAYIWDGTQFTQRDPRRVGPVETPIGCVYVTLPFSGASLPRLNRSSSSSSNRSGNDAQMLLASVLEKGFPLQWPNLTDCVPCQSTGGRCGYGNDEKSRTRRIICLCKGDCNKHKSQTWKVIVGAATGSIFVLLAVLLMFKYKRTSAIFKPSYFGKNQTTGDERNAKEFIKKYQSTLLTKYSYSDIKKMTSGFKERLGAGGYGTVFKGRLSDGRLIAVKMLENYKDNSQNFHNEVTTIGRIHHVNVIRLLGFSWDGSKQALIYEYMPNKSLGDLIYNGETSVSLGLAKLLEIAIGVAHGIEYLHNGCDSRILHLDIKPQNVLLDQNFNPKISDFGLAKVYSRNQSAVTMTGARGTIGYIAPEVFLRNLGNPSHKSDVYSFGMLLLDMVGAKRYVELDVNTSSEAYFPGWIYDKLIEERDVELEDSVVGEEVYIARKMVMVGLWCIQINPRDRPSMTGVVEMLTGNVEAIEMPPKPFFPPPPPPLQLEQEITSIESENSVLPLTSGSREM